MASSPSQAASTARFQPCLSPRIGRQRISALDRLSHSRRHARGFETSACGNDDQIKFWNNDNALSATSARFEGSFEIADRQPST